MKSVLITGGSRGIGAAMVKEFTAKGYKVAFLYKERDDKAREISAETGAVGIRCDVSDGRQVSESVRAARMYLEVPYFDVLVCNAGISITGLFTETTQSQWKEIMDTNLCLGADRRFLRSGVFHHQSGCYWLCKESCKRGSAFRHQSQLHCAGSDRYRYEPHLWGGYPAGADRGNPYGKNW